MKKHIPNAVSILAAILAPLVYYWAVNQEMNKAFLLLIALVVGDMLDGWLARILHAETKIGKDWIDPIKDAVVTGSAMSGLVFQGEGLTNFWIYAFPMLAIGIPLKILKHQHRYESLRLWATVILPYCYIGVITVVLNVYACQAYNWGFAGIVITIPALWLANKYKRHRISAWNSGRR